MNVCPLLEQFQLFAFMIYNYVKRSTHYLCAEVCERSLFNHGREPSFYFGRSRPRVQKRLLYREVVMVVVDFKRKKGEESVLSAKKDARKNQK